MTKKEYQEYLKYLKTRVRNLPFHECLIDKQWQEKGIASIFISRKQPSGKYSFGCYMVDIYCLGLKDTFANLHFTEDEYQDTKNKIFDDVKIIQSECDIVFAHNLIYGAIDYAAEIGFKPHKDFAISEYILNPDLVDDGIDEIEFGQDGQPLYIKGPYDDADKIMAILNRNTNGKYHYIIGEDGFHDEFEF